MQVLEPEPLVSIIVMAYNHLDYTKLCIESLYMNSSHINFELITINNGSEDGTEDYFNSLPHKKKINIEQNCGVDKAFNMGLRLAEGKFLAFISNDLVLTPNWLDNLLKCVQSDENIGMAVPVCNFSSNFQQVSIVYGNVEELYQAAEKYNKSDPKKWEERLRLITYAFIVNTDLLKNLGGFDEIYNPYQFDDDDLSFRIRRAGYKLIVAKDTYVHHFGSVTKRDYPLNNYLQERNRRIFFSRFGVDAWDDTDIDFEMLSLLNFNKSDNVNILGIGFHCGGTVLQAKNRFKEKGCPDIQLWGLTEDEKYMQDLKTICNHLMYDRLENIFDIYKDMRFDCIMMDYELQNIEDPELFLKRIPSILQEDGQMIFAISNELFYKNILDLLSTNPEAESGRIVSRHIKIDNLLKLLEKNGYRQIKYIMQKAEIPEDCKGFIENLRSIAQIENKDTLDELLCTRRFLFSAGSMKPVKKVLFYPGSDIWQKNMVFADKSFINTLGVDTGENFSWHLREEFRRYGYEMSTIDDFDDFDTAEFVIFNDMPKYYGNPFYTNVFHQVYKGNVYLNEFLKRKREGTTKAKLVARLDEPPFVMPENYDKDVHEYFDIIFTYWDDLVDNKKYFKYYSPQPEKVNNPFSRTYAEKKLFIFVGSKKDSEVPGELYKERRKAIEFFDNYYTDDFQFYGKLWRDNEHRNYGGVIKNKLEIMSQYKFCICYENGVLNGWVSEKIFESFFARCVPIYLGAPNITDYVPANTFIDKREFGSYDQLYDFISTMSEERYNEYLANIEMFLESDAYKKFTRSCFAKNLVSIMLKNRKGEADG